MNEQDEADFLFTNDGNGLYTLSSKGEQIMTGTFHECVAEYEKRFEGGN